MATWYGTGSNTSFHITLQPAPCPRCSQPDTVVLRAGPVLELLEEVRKLTHPDVNDSGQATEVTAKVNAFIDEMRRLSGRR